MKETVVRTSQSSCDDGVVTCCSDASQLGSLATSQSSLNAQSSVPYYIFVDGFRGDAEGGFNLNILDGGCESVPVLDNVIDVLDANEDRFGLLKSAFQRAQMTRTLEDEDFAYTIFAPTDDAFRLWLYSMEGQPTEPGDLTAEQLNLYLQYLVAVGNHPTTALLTGPELDTLDGTPIFVDNRGPSFFANGFPIVEPNLWAQNGVVHVLIIFRNGARGADAPCSENYECSNSGYCRALPPPGNLRESVGCANWRWALASGGATISAVNYDEGSCGGRPGNEAVFDIQRPFPIAISVSARAADFTMVLYIRHDECYDPSNEVALQRQ